MCCSSPFTRSFTQSPQVEKEAGLMSPIERTGAIYGWKRAGDVVIARHVARIQLI